MKPSLKPGNPRFSSGPCSKRPGWTPEHFTNATLGRSHRSKVGKAKLKQAIDRTREILEVPADHRIAIVPASDTGAVELVLWSTLGPKPVDVLAWESFGKGWITDIKEQLKLPDVNALTANFGELPDLSCVNPDHDIVFTWNGTTSGVKVPNGDWIASDRGGITICDATSAAFAMDLPWDKLDVVTYSWQKVLGGEAQHGIMILSPRAVERINSYDPPWPMPKLFRLKKNGKLNEAIFEGITINTPSLLLVEDYLDTLAWAESCGGLRGMIRRSEENAAAIDHWVIKTDWIGHLVEDVAIRSNTSVCLKFTDPDFVALEEEAQRAFVARMVVLLEAEDAAYDIGPYSAAPPGLRIWAGSTVETSDLEAAFPWLDWAFGQIMDQMDVRGQS